MEMPVALPVTRPLPSWVTVTVSAALLPSRRRTPAENDELTLITWRSSRAWTSGRKRLDLRGMGFLEIANMEDSSGIVKLSVAQGDIPSSLTRRTTHPSRDLPSSRTPFAPFASLMGQVLHEPAVIQCGIRPPIAQTFFRSA